MCSVIWELSENEIGGNMKSHIQVTKALLKNFSYRTEEGYKVDYLDLRTNLIRTEKINKLGTSTDYYSDECEEFLKVFVEGKLGPISKKAKEFAKGNIDTIKITLEDREDIRKFFHFSFLRSEQTLKLLNKESLTSVLFGGYTHSDLINIGANVELTSLFSNHEATLLLNKTECGFVLPRNCFYSFKRKTQDFLTYILPLNNKVALTLIEKSEFQKHINDGYLYYNKIDDINTIHVLNEFAIDTEKQINSEFVVGKKEELERLSRMNL